MEGSGGAGVLSLHPDNPRYLLFRGRPTVLVTSGEHYGAVINLDFDYVRYLDALAAAGLNLTRIFVGSHVEGDRSLHFAGSDRNTLAPRSGRLIAPWARSDLPGYVNGGNKFDLDRWDERYFARLNDFVRTAAARGVVVEVTLFSNPYTDYTWRHSPLHRETCAWNEVTTLKHPDLIARQEALAQKVIGELKESDNVYFEICNEPEDHRPEVRAWTEHMGRIVHAAAAGKHLIAHNVMRNRAAPANVSIRNHHYTWGRDLIGAIEALAHTERGLLAFDESMGPLLHQTPTQLRLEAWEFLIGGGGIYNGLSWEYTVDQPGGAGRGHHSVLKQLAILKRFMDGLDLPRMHPRHPPVVNAPKAHVRMLADDAGHDHVVYLHHGQRDHRGADTTYVIDPHERRVDLVLQLPAGHFRAYWIDPPTGGVMDVESFAHDRGERRFVSPVHTEDVLLRIRRRKGA